MQMEFVHDFTCKVKGIRPLFVYFFVLPVFFSQVRVGGRNKIKFIQTIFQ